MRFSSLIAVWFLSALLVLASGQAHAKSARHKEDKTYTKILKKWTQSDEVYQREDFYASLKWFATLQNAAMINARVDLLSHIYEYDFAKSEALRAQEHKKFDDVIAFYVSFYAYDYKTDDLARDKNDWKLFLEVDEQKVVPLRIEKVSRVSPVEQSLYPYSNAWAQHYYVYFPKPKISYSSIRLSVFGPAGKSSLVWQEN